MRFTLKEFSFLTASKHFGSAMIDSISFDSRNVKKGTLFVAIRGKNSDGFDWVKDAIRNGASAILTTNSNYSKAKEIIALNNSFLEKTRQVIMIMFVLFYVFK